MAGSLAPRARTAILGILLLSGCGGGGRDLEGSWPPAVPCADGPSAGDAAVESNIFSPGHLVCLHVQMAADDFEKLRVENRFDVPEERAFGKLMEVVTESCTAGYPGSYHWYEADISVDGEVRKRVGIRKKGFLGSVLGDGKVRPSLKFRTDKFVPGQRLGSLKRITVHNSLQDPSRVQTCMGYSVFAAAGHPAPLCNLANVVINGEPFGAYAHVEDLKKAFLRRAFGDDSGSLYEGTIAGFTPGFLADALQGNLGRWEAKTSSTDTRGKPLLAVVEALAVPDAELVTSLAPIVNLDRFFTFWALELLIGHSDSFSGMRNNFFVYFDPLDGGRATFVPWGADNVMNAPAAEVGDGTWEHYTYAELPRRLSRMPKMVERLHAELRRLLDSVWDEEALLQRLDVLSAHVRASQNDPDHDGHIDAMRAWIKGRRAQIEALLDAGMPAGAATSHPCNELPGGLGELQEDGIGWLSTVAFGG